jgi:hypothetical protein
VSDEFTKVHRQYAPNVMLFGISSLATSSLMTDANKSSKLTATDNTASTLNKREASKDSREEVSFNSVLNGRMSVNEIVTTEIESKVKQQSNTKKAILPTNIFGFQIHHTLGFSFPLYNHIALTLDLPDMLGVKVLERL